MCKFPVLNLVVGQPIKTQAAFTCGVSNDIFGVYKSTKTHPNKRDWPHLIETFRAGWTSPFGTGWWVDPKGSTGYYV